MPVTRAGKTWRWILASGLFFASFYFVSQAQASSNVCCLYYSNPNPTNKCRVFDMSGNGMDVPVAIDGANTVNEFDCSLVNNSTGEIGKEPFIKNGQDGKVVYPANLNGGKAGYLEPVAYGNATVEVCPKIDGYKIELLKQLGSTPEKQLCTIGSTKGANNPVFSFELGEANEKLKEEAKKVLQDLQSIANTVCCVPKKINPNTSCFPPKIRSDIAADLGAGKSLNQLSVLKPPTPSTANPYVDDEVAKFYTCEESGDWSSNYVLSGWACKTIMYNEVMGWPYDIANCSKKKYYCLCRKDGTACDSTAYDKLQTADKAESNTENKACAPAMYGKNGGETNEQLKWECIYTTPPLNQKGNDYCAHLATPPGQYQAEDFLMPKEVKDLNKIGTLDPKILLGRFIRAATGIMGSIALAMLVYGGILFMISAGNSERTEKGRSILVWSSLGLIVILTSYALVNLILTIF